MQFRYTLIDYTSGSAVNTVVPEPLGWDGLTLKLERDKDYHGFFEYSDDEMAGLKFYNQGHDILKNAFDTYGIEAKVELKIEILCSPQVAAEEDEGDADQWLQLFYGRIDFDRTRFECGLKGCFAEAAATTFTCLMTLRNRFDQKVNLDSNTDFDGNALTDYSKLGFDMALPGKKILYAFNATQTTPFEYTFNYLQEMPVVDIHSYGWNFNFNNVHYSSLFKTNNVFTEQLFDSGGTGIGDLVTWLTNLTPFIEFKIPNNNLCNEEYSIKYRAVGNISFTTTATITNCGIYAACLIMKADGSIVDLDSHNYRPSLDPMPAGTYTFPVNINVDTTNNLAEDDLVYFQFIIYNLIATEAVTIPFTFHFDELWVNIYSESFCPESNADVYMVNEALSRTVEAVTNDCLRVYSNYFGRTDALPYANTSGDGCAGLEVISNGRKIRNAILTDATQPRMFVSFKELVEGLNAIHNIGYGLEPDTFRGNGYQLLRIEPFEYFYQNTLLLNCLNVPALKSSVMVDMYYSRYIGGYKKWEAEQLAGPEDFHGQREYRTALSTINKDLSQLSNLIASGYSIEVTRRQAGSENKDWRYDDDIFIICVKRNDDDIVVDLNNVSSSANIYSPETAYNFAISPARNAMRWVKRIAQSLLPNWNVPAGILKFSAGQSNYVAAALHNNTTCRIEGVQVSESQDIAADDFRTESLAQPLMYNILDEFEYPLSFKDYMNIVTSPYGRIKYSCNNGELYYGFIKSIKYKPTDGKATFQLLRAYTD